MPVKQLPGIIGPSNQETTDQFDDERTINLSPVIDKERNRAFLERTSGTKTIQTLGSPGDIGREAFDKEDNMYTVVGNKVYKQDQFLTTVEIGTLTTSTGYVGIASDGLTVVFVDGAFGYVYTVATDSFDQITAPAFPTNPIDVAFQQGFYVVAEGGSNRFFQCAEGRPDIWNAENFASANANGDNLIAIRSLNDRLWLCATNSITIWENQPSAGFAFRQDTNILYNIGVYNAKSTRVDEGHLFFHGRTTAGPGSVYMTTGATPKPVSTRATDVQLARMVDKNNSEAFIYKENGQLYYQLSFNTDNRTLVYNSTSDKWFERMMIDRARHIASTYCYFQEKGYILSYNSNELMEMGPEYLTDNGLPIYRCRITPPMTLPTNFNFIINSITVLTQSGSGINGNPIPVSPIYTQGANPQMYLSIARAGNKVFGNAHARPLGRIGHYGAQVRFQKLGRMQAKAQCTLKFEVFDPVDVNIMGATIDYTECFR